MKLIIIYTSKAVVAVVIQATSPVPALSCDILIKTSDTRVVDLLVVLVDFGRRHNYKIEKTNFLYKKNPNPYTPVLIRVDFKFFLLPTSTSAERWHLNR